MGLTPGDDSLIEAYLRYLRGQGDLPDLDGLEPEEAAEARELFELLDATADMGRELPAFEDDPVAHALGLVPGDGDPTPRGIRRQGGPALNPSPPLSLVAPVVLGEEGTGNRSEGRRGSSRGRGAGRGSGLAAVAAAVALVVLAVAPGGVLRGTTPAGAVESGTLTSECDTTFRGGGDDGDAKHHLVVAAVWADEERARFMEVLQRFSNKTGIDVSFATDPAETDRDIAETLQTLGRDGCAPDVALLPQPGLLADLAKSGDVLPIDDIVGEELERNYSTAWQELGRVKGQSYGVWFKAANKSLIWYNANAFRRAGIERPPADLKGLMDAAERLLAVGITPFAIGGGGEDGWVLSDWFENVYLSTAGGDSYDKLARGDIRWTDPSVKRALATLAEIFAKEEWLAGGRTGARELDLRGAVEKVFANPTQPQAAMVFEGDFVANLVAETPSRVGVDARFFPFPSIERSEPAVVPALSPGRPGETGGDVAVLMKPTDEGKRLLRFLATAEAAEPWVRRGGFISPNKKVDLEDYPDPDSRRAARELVSATELRFDLSDLLPPEFGSNPDDGMWKILQDFLAAPHDIDGTAQRLEEKSRQAAPRS